jgi:hypothetical protein
VYSARWSPHLRQGDVIGPLPYPKLKSPPQKIAKPQGWSVGAELLEFLELPADQRLAIIVSHDCEFTEARRAHFLIARVQDFAANLTPETRDAIRSANAAIEPAAVNANDQAGVGEEEELGTSRELYDYIDTFALDPLPGCFEEMQLVSFTTITSLPRTMIETVAGLKRAELEHQDRVLLRRKLGFFLGRDADDIADEKKMAPAVR